MRFPRAVPGTRVMRRTLRPLALLSLALVVTVLGTLPAEAAVRVSRAELSGTRLRLEGTAAPNRSVTVNGVAMGTSDAAGSFRIERDPFGPPADCRVAVDDGSGTPAVATLSGCTVTPASAAALSAVTVNPKDVVGGNASTGTVSLTSAAPAGGFLVSLSSDNTAAATVPPSVTVPAGSASATFGVSTNQVNAQSSDIIGTAGGVTKYAIVTVWDEFHFTHGSISIVPGGGGSGTITSQPAGISCTITGGNGSGTCSSFFPAGTVVRLDARAAANSSFQGWRGLPGCADPSRITVARATNINCQPGFALK
jgi:hypothetical protein